MRSTEFGALHEIHGHLELGWASIQPGMHFHDLRHTHKTWLIEDHVPRILQLQRLGHKRKDVDDDDSHVTRMMIEAMLAALQQRWEQYGTWTWDDHHANAELIA